MQNSVQKPVVTTIAVEQLDLFWNFALTVC
jgi:hypothetical protein